MFSEFVKVLPLAGVSTHFLPSSAVNVSSRTCLEVGEQSREPLLEIIMKVGALEINVA
jgi:hypothetical protein